MEQQFSSLDRVMEPETISKNGASSKSPMSRRNFLRKTCFAVLNILAGALFLAVFTACGSGGKIKMTTETSSDNLINLLKIGGSGTATINWGDGSEKVTLELEEYGVMQGYTYPSAKTHTVTVNGEEITELVCTHAQLKSLDVSKNTELEVLNCSNNQLTKLDVSKNTELEMLNCSNNQLTVAALNALFGTLHDESARNYIFIGGNPGAADCDRSIAENKGWIVRNY